MHPRSENQGNGVAYSNAYVAAKTEIDQIFAGDVESRLKLSDAHEKQATGNAKKFFSAVHKGNQVIFPPSTLSGEVGDGEEIASRAASAGHDLHDGNSQAWDNDSEFVDDDDDDDDDDDNLDDDIDGDVGDDDDDDDNDDDDDDNVLDEEAELDNSEGGMFNRSKNLAFHFILFYFKCDVTKEHFYYFHL